MLPKFRTQKYVIWHACNRFNIRPPGVKSSWDDCDATTQAELLAYDSIRAKEDYDSGNVE